MQDLLITGGAWHLRIRPRRSTPRLYGWSLCTEQKCHRRVTTSRFRRAGLSHMAMTPFIISLPRLDEQGLCSVFPVWKAWLQSQRWPECNVRPFNHRICDGALSNIQTQLRSESPRCPNSHPSFYGFCSVKAIFGVREEKVPIRVGCARIAWGIGKKQIDHVQSKFCKESMIL